MITFIFSFITFLSTFFSVFHLVSSLRYYRYPSRPASKELGFSIIIPCYNEAPILKNTILGLLRLEYRNMEAIFVNDGSKDATIATLTERLDLQFLYNGDNSVGFYQSQKHPWIYVIDKGNTGKAASLNTGIAFCHKEIVITLDGDCVLEKDALNIINHTFQDQDVVASGGVVHVMQYFLQNQKKKPVISLQTLDFIKGFYIYKSSLAYNNALSIISGAFGAFRKSALEEVGGFRSGLGEDIDITIRMQEFALKNNKKITYDLGAVCYTECPETWRDLARQRIRWQKAFVDALIQNKKFLLRNFFRSNACFFLLADAAFIGSMAVLCFICNLALIMLKCVYGFQSLFLFITLLAVVFNALCSLIAVLRARRMTPENSQNVTSGMEGQNKSPAMLTVGFLAQSICMDIIWFSFLRIYYFLAGTLSYSLNNRKWDKLSRTNNSYQV